MQSGLALYRPLVIREATADDAAGWTDLGAVVYPEFVRSARAFRHYLDVAPAAARPRWWCAEEDGRIVASAAASLVVETSEPGVAWLTLTVHPHARCRGLGGELLRLAEAHVAGAGARRVLCRSRDDERTIAFAEAHGYAQTSSDDVLVVDPRTVTGPGELPAGVELVPAATFEADPRPLYEVEAEAVADEPGDVALDAIPYDLWLDEFWGNPDIDRELSAAALVDGVPVSSTFLNTDRASGRGLNNGTCTLRAFRSRGLATLAKRFSLARAAEAGITAVYTGNDTTNAPMQAINRTLGYRRCAGMANWVKHLA